MKKVLSLVLALSLVLGTFSMTFAATTFNDVKGENCESAVNVLVDLGVVTGYEDGTYKPEGIVTRAEMAVLVVKALGLEDYVTSTAKSSFTDMANYGWAEGYIAYAQSLGVISGYGDGTFRPGNTVSYDEAATMMVAALGYTPDSLQGTWPANYVTQAKALGILDGIKSGAQGANRGDVATMLYQALDQAIGKVDKDGNWNGIGIEFDKDGRTKVFDTMLNRLGASLYEPKAYVDEEDDSFIMTNAIADDAVINVREYIGAVVSAYANSDGDIIAIKEVFSDFITGTYDDETFSTIDGVDYDYNFGKNVSSTVGAFFYNGTEASKNDSKVKGYTLDSKALEADTYYTLAVDLSGKKIQEVYTIMKWDITDGVQVDADDIADIKDDHKLLGVDFPETNKDEIDTTAFELMGVNSLDDIKVDDVVYVYKNLDDEIGRVAVGNTTVTGEVSKVSKNDKEVTVDGKVYKYASDELLKNGISNDATTDRLGVDDEVTLALDAYGFIFDYDKTAGTADKFAVVLKTGYSGGFDNDLQIKLFLADGTTSTFDVDDDDIKNTANRTDNIIDTNGNWMGDWTSQSAIAGKLIKYGINKSGEVDSIEVTTGRVTSGDKAITAKGYWAGKEIKSDAVVFTYDGDDKSDSDNYTATTKDKVLDSDAVDGFYSLDNNKIEAMLVLNFSSNEDVFGVLTDWSAAKDDLYDLVMYVDGKEVTYKADYKPGANAETEGTVKKIKFNSAGEVNELSTSLGKDVSITSATIISTAGIELSGSTLTIDQNAVGDGEYTLDSNVAVYLLDGDDWSIERKSELKNLKNDDIVTLYNTDDDDYDLTTIVVIKRP